MQEVAQGKQLTSDGAGLEPRWSRSAAVPSAGAATGAARPPRVLPATGALRLGSECARGGEG